MMVAVDRVSNTQHKSKSRNINPSHASCQYDCFPRKKKLKKKKKNFSWAGSSPFLIYSRNIACESRRWFFLLKLSYIYVRARPYSGGGARARVCVWEVCWCCREAESERQLGSETERDRQLHTSLDMFSVSDSP